MNRYVRNLIDSNCTALEKGPQTMENIYKITFSHPTEIMAEWLDDKDERAFMTFGEGDKKVKNAAARLTDIIGSSDQWVALDMENGPDWIIGFWAILMSGNRPYLVNRRHPAALTRGIVSTLGIMYSVCADETSYPCMVVDINSLKGEGKGDFEPGKWADGFALSTSATTLNEVICIYTGAEVASQILNCREILSENDLMPKFYKGQLKQLAFLPFYHIFGLMAVYFWFAFFARPMVFMKDYSAESILGTVRKLNVTHIFAVPMLWHTIEDRVKAEVKAQGPAKEKKFEKGLELSRKLQKAFPTLGRKIALSLFGEVTGQLFGKSPSFLISGGGYVRDSALYMFNGIGYALHNGYGMSETGITSVELRKTMEARLQNSVGRPFSSVEYRIDDDGLLHVAGGSICHKMIRNGEEIEISDSYSTGDVAAVDGEGNYYIKGRVGDRIIGENGENINPDDIEKELQLEHALEFSVLGLGDGADEKPALVIQLPRDLSTADINETAKSAREQIAKLPSTYQISQLYFTFDAIRSETAIKVSRPYLRKGLAEGNIRLAGFDEVLEGSVSGREPVAADDEMGLAIRKVFAEFCGKDTETITMDDHFIFDLGGTSLDYFSLVMQINEELGIRLVFDKDNSCYTIRQFERAAKRLKANE